MQVGNLGLSGGLTWLLGGGGLLMDFWETGSTKLKSATPDVIMSPRSDNITLGTFGAMFLF